MTIFRLSFIRYETGSSVLLLYIPVDTLTNCSSVDDVNRYAERERRPQVRQHALAYDMSSRSSAASYTL